LIQKQRPAGHFTMIGNEMFRDTRLNLTDRGLLSTLLSLPDTWDFTIKGLVEILPDGRSRIRQSLKKLEDLGYLTIIQERTSNGEFRGNTIEVRSQLNSPLSENPTADNPTADNQTQYNKYKYNTIINIKNNNSKPKYSFQNFNQRAYSSDDYEMLEKKMRENKKREPP